MTSVTFHFPKYKLNKLLREPGGKTAADAVSAANANLSSIKGDCLDAVDGIMVTIGSSWEPTDDPRASLLNLYSQVNRLIGVASAAGLVELDRAAYSLCDLLDRMASSGRCDGGSINVHIRALHLLRYPLRLGKGSAIREILLGLKSVRDKYAAGANESA